MNRITLAIVAIGMVACCQPAVAQLSQWQRDRMVEAAKSSIEQLDADRIPDKDAAEEALHLALYQLQQHLQQKADASNAQAWTDYLAITEMIKALQAEDEKRVLSAAQKIRDRSIGVAPGLEVTAVRGVRDATERLANAYRLSKKEALVKLVTRQLEALAEKWSEVDSVPSVDDAARLTLVLSILQQMNQDVSLLQEARQQFSRPNANVMVGEAFVQRAVQRSINQSRPVRECILGTSISGTAHMMGNVTASLIPSDGAVRVQVALTGQVTSNNTGVNGPVRLRTTGLGQVYSYRTITVSESGVVASPTQTTATLSTQINAIEHPLRLVRRIARKKAAEQKPKADQIALGKLQSQVGTQFADETSQALSKPLPNPMDQLRPWLLRLDLPTPSRNIGSTSDSVYAHAMLRHDWQLASPTSAPPAPGGYEAVVQIHESLIDNSIGHVLSGRTIGEKELQKLLEGRGKNASAASNRDADSDDEESKEPFEIDFTRSRPVVFEAREGKIRIGVRGTRFSQGKKSTEGRIPALEITADYIPVKTTDGVVLLKRDGDVSIEFPGSRSSKIFQAGIRNTIRKRFEDVFPEYLMDQPWTVPPTVTNDAIRNRVYRPRYVTAENGWLTIAVN
ncbi:hypothetical protein [Stieleria varia]|nr:hypothetical protein [Stieleria varia]